jgi:glycine hydroxymethyltransferase
VANARALADALAARGFRIVSGGTDNHLFLLSLVGRELTGKAVQEALERAGITANKNMGPYDPRKPMVTSGVRMGTPALTTRGMEPDDMRRVAEWIVRVLEAPDDATLAASVRSEVREFTARFPLFAERWHEAG